MEGTAETISGVRVLGGYRLQIRLTQRAGDFVARLTMPYFCPISARTPPDQEIAATEVPASGPYRFVEHLPAVRSSWSGIATTAVSAPPMPTASSGRSRSTRA